MATKRRPTDDGLPPWFITLLKVLGLGAVVAAILGAAWMLSAMGPNRVAYSKAAYVDSTDIPTNVLAMLDKSKEEERQFRDAEKNRPITAADLPKLEEAIKLQQDYTRITGQGETTADDRLMDMRTSLQNYQTDPIREQSLDLEQKAENAENAGKNNDAIELLQEASKLQAQINQDYTLTKNRDFSRVAMIAHHIGFLTAQPLAQERDAREAAARAELAKKDWSTAQVDFQKAYDLQAQLNRDFSDQQFTDMQRQEDLYNQLVSLRSTGAHLHVEQLWAQGNTTADPMQAAQYLQDALREQRDLIKNFPQSQFADAAEVETIDTQLQTTLSKPVAEEITRQAGTLAAALRARHDQEARDTVAVLVQKVEHFQENFPRSPLLQGDLEQRLEYINFKAADLAAIQDQVYAQLLPLPGQKRWNMLKVEMPQALYQLVIGGNPSRNHGDKLPVDSVSWADAQEFCRHLEWVLARPVRLPTMAEFKLALGPTDTVDVTAVSWNLDNSGGKTQPVGTKAANAAGFYDLLGNVAEWLDRPADADEDKAPVAGGNAQTPVDAVRDAEIATIPMQDRSRLTGFRIVVDLDETAPVTGVGPTLAGGNTTVAPLPGMPVKSTDKASSAP